MNVTEEKDVLENVADGLTVKDVMPKREKLWFFYPGLLKLNIFLLIGILCQVVSGYDGSMMNGIQALESWQNYFDHPAGGRLGTMVNGNTIGTLITVPFVTFMCDYLGRRLSIIIGCCVIIIGATLQGAAQNFSMFMGSRILLGIGGCIASAAAGPYVTECAYPTHRAQATAMMLASWPLGSFVAALVTWAAYYSNLQTSTWSWRVPSILQGFFPLIQLALALIAPESPRWLIAKGKVEKARNFFVKYHAEGEPDQLIVKMQMAEIMATIEEEKTQHMSNVIKWIKSPGLRHRLFICFFVPAMLQLEGNALISYYLHIILNNIGITDSLTQLKFNIGLTVWALVASVVIASVVDRFNRRTVFMSGLSSMCFCYVIWTILSAINQQRNFEDKGLAAGVVTMIYLYNGCNVICAVIGTPYVMEICPYFMRATGSMIYQLSGNVVGLFNNYVNPIAMEAITWKYYIVWCCNLVFLMVIVYFFFPETRGHDLEDVAEVFGSDVVGGRAAVRKQMMDGEKHFDNNMHLETAAAVEQTPTDALTEKA
ncbi:general substrate transporter [Lipomyces arxii]|uniref:general substrate transporter n=1 Tax=Lipomyces arxii TaxID=56418 RepID=UPI0034D002C9